jgi:hypothetical protein
MMKLFHGGYLEIPSPDIHYGRTNADFGQGFYLSDSAEFAGRWVREKTGADIIVNSYELDETGLNIKYFDRDREWFSYVFSNRRSMPDKFNNFDIILGPIANDTIFDTMGIMTSGFLSDEEALRLLCIGPQYRQIVIKSERAAQQLKFISAEKLSQEMIIENSKKVAADQEEYLLKFAEVMEGFEKEE